eukprot:TRINITY_DN190_c2_g1_i1.p1 TRINITY_DN190_c2_g1~~TRINITY_DN190_c2_g1_i1.p1  ORF type:complete len:157 (-),score=25.83 TRINITY_DN190_c2_g1_i1:207-677(-)
MLLTSPSTTLFHLPLLKSPQIHSNFLNGSFSIALPTKPSLSPNPPPSYLPPIRAMKKMQGRVVCATNDKTVAVEVVRLAPHPKYKRRIRLKKKYQAHDPDNQFKVGDVVQLEKSRPISKTKAFVAVPVVSKNKPPKPSDPPVVPQELGLPLQSLQL